MRSGTSSMLTHGGNRGFWIACWTLITRIFKLTPIIFQGDIVSCLDPRSGVGHIYIFSERLDKLWGRDSSDQSMHLIYL